MQKKALYGLMIAGLISGSTALAGGPDIAPPQCMDCFRPYVGVHYTYLDPDRLGSRYFFGYPASTGTPLFSLIGNTHGVASDYSGIGFSGGIKYGQFLGMEWGWTHFFGETINSNAGSVTSGTVVASSYESRADMYYWDIRGYYPIFDTFDLIGSVGAGILTFNNALLNSPVNLRVGLGADYYLTHNWGIEAMFHWVPNSEPVCGNPGAGFATAGTTGATYINQPSQRLFGCSYSSYWTVTASLNYMFS